jgi:hypothetical protein
LFDLPLQFLRLASKLHPLQLGDQQLQVGNLILAGEQLVVLRSNQRSQRIGW